MVFQKTSLTIFRPMKNPPSKSQALSVFNERVKPRIRVDSNECWTLPLSHNGRGYAYLHVRSLKLRIGSHVLAYIAFNGNVPADHNVLHKCDNPSCCNPSHLFAGTQLHNIQDMDAKGRRRSWHPVGDLNPAKRFDVREKLSIVAQSRIRNEQGRFRKG